MTTQDLINTLKQGKPMTAALVREIVKELEGKTEQLRTMSTALRAKDADYVALKEAAKPVAKMWANAKATFLDDDVAMPVGVTFEPTQLESWAEMTAEQLDALAALVGEGLEA